ncbi:hypothetical protein AGMMS49944_23880 [Spirochaetia bacterium]|nr:hypothetical protein AGMMS49944_23880 [Spirochaetia bacterium]
MKTNLIENRQIRIFISSTFRDMMAERDYLVNRVFPVLRRYCEERDVSLFELDLRWGISEEESKQGKVVDICLKEIQRTTPFFIGLLGERYGWVPSEEERAVIGKNTGVFEDYPWITAELEEGTSITEIEIQEGVLRAKERVDAYFYFRSPKMEVVEEFKEPKGSHAAKMLGDLKKVLREQQAYPVKEYDSIENLGALIEQDFKALVDTLFPQGALSPLEKERLEQRTFLKSRTAVYVPHPGYAEKLDAFIQGDEQSLVITGDSGMGKSALLANWIQNRAADDNEKIIYYFIGASRSGGDYRKITETIGKEICDAYRKPDEVNYWQSMDEKHSIEPIVWGMQSEKQKLEHVIAHTELSSYKRKTEPANRLVIVLDGVEKLFDIDNAKLLNWLPDFPKTVKVLYSTVLCDSSMEVFARRGYEALAVEPLSLEKRKELIVEYLKAYAKSLLPAQIERIAGDRKCENTLALRTLLDELRVFGVHEQIDAQIDRYLAAPDLDCLFALILERLESIFSRDLVPGILSLIGVSRAGLSEPEILELSRAVPLYWSQLFNAIATHAVTRNGLVSFSHTFIRDAVNKRYLQNHDTERVYRRLIAAYMEGPAVSSGRKYDEYPHQVYALKDWDKLYHFLLNFEVFEYLYKKDLYELGKYWRALQEADSEKYSLERYAVLDAAGRSTEELADLYGNIEYALTKTLGDYALSLKFALLALTFRDTALARNHIGAVYYSLGDYQSAMEQYQKALAIEAEAMGTPDLTAAASYNGMSAVYYSLGDYQAALETNQRALEIQKEVLRYLGENHPDMAASYYNFGTIYNSSGDYLAALDNHRKALAIRQEILGENHPDTALSYVGVGDVFRTLGAYQAAMDWYPKALAIQEQLFGKDHPGTKKVRDSIAAVLKKLE